MTKWAETIKLRIENTPEDMQNIRYLIHTSDMRALDLHLKFNANNPNAPANVLYYL